MSSGLLCFHCMPRWRGVRFCCRRCFQLSPVSLRAGHSLVSNCRAASAVPISRCKANAAATTQQGYCNADGLTFLAEALLRALMLARTAATTVTGTTTLRTKPPTAPLNILRQV